MVNICAVVFNPAEDEERNIVLQVICVVAVDHGQFMMQYFTNELVTV